MTNDNQTRTNDDQTPTNGQTPTNDNRIQTDATGSAQADRPDAERHARVEHLMERTYEVTATPEQVWDAIATADGISAWMVPTRLDPRVDGAVTFDLGDFQSTGVVTGYTPHQRFAYEEPWPLPERVEDIPAGMRDWFDSIGVPMSQIQQDRASLSPIATEFLIEAVSGGSCVIRVVASAYGNGADWENEFFTEMVDGWSQLLDNLPTYLQEVAA